MSHYTVAVVHPNNVLVDELLAPYDEDIEVEPYVYLDREEFLKRVRDTLEWGLNYYKDKDDQESKEKLEIYQSLEKALKNNNEEEIKNLAEEIGYNLNDNLEELSTYNPDSKWDWWKIGGRWSGLFNGKNEILVKDFPKPFETTLNEQELKEAYPQEFEEYNELITNGKGFYRPEYFQRNYNTFYSYLKSINEITTYAICTPDGWFESGKMGWFAISYATPEEHASFKEKYYDIISQYPDDWVVTLVDCHI